MPGFSIWWLAEPSSGQDFATNGQSFLKKKFYQKIIDMVYIIDIN